MSLVGAVTGTMSHKDCWFISSVQSNTPPQPPLFIPDPVEPERRSRDPAARKHPERVGPVTRPISLLIPTIPTIPPRGEQTSQPPQTSRPEKKDPEKKSNDAQMIKKQMKNRREGAKESERVRERDGSEGSQSCESHQPPESN